MTAKRNNKFDFDKLYEADTYKEDLIAQVKELQDIADNAKAFIKGGEK